MRGNVTSGDNHDVVSHFITRVHTTGERLYTLCPWNLYAVVLATVQHDKDDNNHYSLRTT